MFIITTDGQENASREFNHKKVKKMVERQKSKYGWEFIFLGANIDAIETAGRFGISANRAVNYHADKRGTELAFQSISDVSLLYRKEAMFDDRCFYELQADFEKRKK
jgi:hypothetical protein